ncbi:Ulilysin [Fibrella aestuarina BUZ 2]|uniref:Ulilysin n=2 Tax=Fibrella TaxID=861914 RepID=I0K7N8_9BACT|nr:Ulilysin [Fibrella aestuarina BUZ 2]
MLMKKQDNKRVLGFGFRVLSFRSGSKAAPLKTRNPKPDIRLRVGLAGLFLWAACGSVALAQTTVADEPLRECASEIVEWQLQQRFPQRRQRIDALNQQVRMFGMINSRARGTDEEIYRIPVVVHVVHNNSNNTIGGANNPNISDEQILSQIRVLNEDYRKIAGTPGGSSTNPLAVDTGIEFFLATTDPNGLPTNGITRTYTTRTGFDITSYQDQLALSNLVYWPTNRYLNLWVCANSATRYLGYGQFPTVDATSVPGLTDVTDERIDGLVVDNRYFGAGLGTVTSRLYCCGRTVTHEVGHWLGLLHPNGDTRCGDDYVDDTPVIEALNNVSETSCTPVFSTCTGTRTRNLIEDYMDYTPDACMNVFTGGQRDRMRAVLQLSARRRQVLSSAVQLAETDQLTLTVYPNPVSSQEESTVDVQFKGSQPFEAGLYDVSGRLLKGQAYTASLSRRITLSGVGLSAGIYILRITTPTETATKRVLVR